MILYRESKRNPQGLEPFLVCSASPSKPLASFSNYATGAQMAPPQPSHVLKKAYYGNCRQNIRV